MTRYSWHYKLHYYIPYELLVDLRLSYNKLISKNKTMQGN